MIFAIVLHVLCYDIWFYVSHIFLHNYLYASVHNVHHSMNHETMTYPDTNVGHIAESIVSPMGILVPLFFYKTLFLPFIISSVIVGFRALMRHDVRCSWLIGNHHILHHKYPTTNYGEYWLDYLFGTNCLCKTDYIHSYFSGWYKGMQNE
jgi:lathosterol oxidase